MSASLSIGQCAALACLWEVSATKPGNVHRAADFEDTTFVDFATSAVAIGPIFDAAADRTVGEIVLAAVQATQQNVANNTNLGMLLLLAPLAKAASEKTIPASLPKNIEAELCAGLRAATERVLASLDARDCALVYEAIRLARPGGLNSVSEADVAGPPPEDLLAAMRLAADRDLVARQYANNFAEIFELAVPALAEGLARGWALNDVIVHTFLTLMRDRPDTLIERKCGREVAEEAASYAASVLRSGVPGDDEYADALADLDFWLRADGHRRNPGTSADLIAAGLFVVLQQGIVKLPIRFYQTG